MSSSSRNIHRGRSGTSSSTCSRYKQEYPPTEEFMTSFVTSPVRRASSETRLSVLHQKGVVERLEKTRDKLKSTEDNNSGGGSQVWGAGECGDEEQHGGDIVIPVPPVPAPKEEEKPYLKLEFEDCIDKHPNTLIIPKLNHFLSLSYKYTKLVVYCIFLVVVGVPLTFVWGCINGSTIFCCMWVWSPILKLILLCVHSCAPTIVVPVQVVCGPIVDVSARIFRQIRFQAIILGRPSLDKIASQI